MFNNYSVVKHIAEILDADRRRSQPARRNRVLSEPCLPSRLPSTAFIQRDAARDAPKAVVRQLRRTPTPPASPPEEGYLSRDRRKSTGSTSSSPSTPKLKLASQRQHVNAGKPWKDPQPFEVFRAVERKDLMYLMEVRDRAFHLLLRRTGDATPLVHAMRIGQSHRDVAIVLLGAFSRYVNNLADEEYKLPKTKILLKALRTNLKLAIDYGLQSAQSELIASFLQTLIMSEGEKWVWAQVSNASLALRAGTAGKPVHTAESAVRSFATKELGKAQSIAALEEYVANATADLLMMGVWSIVLDSVQAEPIPSWYFARDDRVYKAFTERLDQYKGPVGRLGRRVRWQIRVLRQVLEGKSVSYRGKVDTLVDEFDEGEGV